MIGAGLTSTVFRQKSGGEEHDTSQTPSSQFVEIPRSMGLDNFIVKLACLFFS